jgi:hypothetical protein
MLALALCLAQTPAPRVPPVDRKAEDARALAAFASLEAPARKEFLEFLELEIGQARLFQHELLRYVLRADGRAPADFPEAGPATWFDPATHAPAQPIARRALAPDSPALLAGRRELLAGNPPRALASAWSYDYGRREVVRLPGWDDPARSVANALAGYAPGYDRAEALVERALDDGAQQKALAAFGHLYTDRAGNAFPGVTLYDAWSSGAEIEMPDVDTLGLYHALTGDFGTYHAPVPGSRQGPLYEALGQPFRDARSHRALRHALALVCLEGQPGLGIYDGLLLNLHLAWEKAHSTPAELAPTLPSVAKRQAWIDALIAEGRGKPEAWAAAELRRDTLARAGEVVRAITLAGLQEFGAFKKLDEPEKQDH